MASPRNLETATPKTSQYEDVVKTKDSPGAHIEETSNHNEIYELAKYGILGFYRTILWYLR